MSDSFATTSKVPAVGSDHFVFDQWDSIRNRVLPPQLMRDLAESDVDRREFIGGMTLLRETGATRKAGHKLQPQQLLVADVLAAGHRRNVLLIPRRSTKSTSCIGVGLGRAQARDDYRVAILTMTTGKAGRSRFLKDVEPNIRRLFPDQKTGDAQIRKGAGMERIEFRESGGFMQWMSSIDDFRGEAFDLIFLDEAGEPDPEKVAEAIAAAMPTMDTRPGAQIVVLGTAGDYREGNLLWDWLEQSRTNETMGSIGYMADQDLTVDDIDTWEKTVPLLVAMHPGIDTLTTIESIRENYESFPRDKFLKEYLSVFGRVGGGSFINMQKWGELADNREVLPGPPAHFRVGLAVHPFGTSASIMAAWRVDGVAHVLNLEHKAGVNWVDGAVRRICAKYRVPYVFDSASGNALVEVQKLNRARPKPKGEPQTSTDVATAAALFMKEYEADNLVHYGEETFDAAAACVTQRFFNNSKRYAFGRKNETDDILDFEAGSMALRAYDDSKPRTVTVMVTG